MTTPGQETANSFYLVRVKVANGSFYLSCVHFTRIKCNKLYKSGVQIFSYIVKGEQTLIFVSKGPILLLCYAQNFCKCRMNRNDRSPISVQGVKLANTVLLPHNMQYLLQLLNLGIYYENADVDSKFIRLYELCVLLI